MNQPIVQSLQGITLAGGAPITAALFRLALQRAPVLVAADGGADRCLAHGHAPRLVIGDMDSISDQARAVLGPDRLHLIAEQETTDFDKALRSVAAPFVLALGFIGARLDHGLAVLTSLVQSPVPCILIGAQDIVFHVPSHLDIALPRGDRFSLFPMAEVRGTSSGLDWPIDGLTLSPAGRVGTSNRVSGPRVALSMSGPGTLCILPRRRLDQALAALSAALPRALPRADSRSR